MDNDDGSLIRILGQTDHDPFLTDGEAFSACRFTFDPKTELPSRIGLPEGIRIDVADHLSRAVSKRKAEYVAGRYCAMRALLRLTGNHGDIGMGRAGEPLWPTGITGSITHSAEYAAAIVSADRRVRGIGLDLEPTISERDIGGIRAYVMNPRELRAGGGAFSLAQIGTLVFSAKEAIYKAIYPSVGRFVEFDEMELVGLHGDVLSFMPNASLGASLGGCNEIAVQFRIMRNDFLSLCRIPARSLRVA